MRFIQEIKKFVLIAILFLCAAVGTAQRYIQGSISRDATVNTVDIWFKANHNSVSGEYLNYFQMSVAIPAAGNGAVTATAIAINGFQDMGTLLLDGPYTEGTEIVFNFIYLNPAPPTPNNFAWTSGVDFIGVKITFAGGPGPAQIKMVDFTNAGGGINTNTFFGMLSNVEDKTNYPNLFYQIPGLNVLGNYPNGDQYVKTTDIVGLPVSLLEFSGYKDGSSNQLKWATGSEQNSSGFEVQRSSDQVNFTSLGFVKTLAPGGNSSGRLNYSFADAYPPGLQQYYRLRLVDRNGGSRYSNVILIRRDKPLTLSIDGIFPNPVRSTLNLRVNAAVAGSLSVVVTDMSGKKLIERKVNAEVGYNLFPVPVDHLPAAMYMIRVSGEDGEVLKKFVRE